MKRVAILDLGSNTARLVLFEVGPGYYRLLDELRQVVRLSEGMRDGILRADAFERGLEAITTFRAYCDAVGVDDLRATATSAVRDAANGQAFLNAARSRGVSLRVLPGEEEAFYGALAVANSSTLEDGFVLDIGGGSAQLSRLEGRRFVAGRSWPLGAVRTTEAYLSDPPKKKEVRALAEAVRGALADAAGFGTFGDGSPLVGLGGTVRNLAKIEMARSAHPLDLPHGFFLSTSALAEVTELLLERPTAERAQVPGLNTDRADIIAAGAVVAREIVALSGAPGLTISAQGIREGLLYPYLVPDEPHLLEDVRAFSVASRRRHFYDHPAHNDHVRTLALTLFDELKALHGYGPFERELLSAAAQLHDIGMAVNYFDHHKHGFYLLLSEALPGFSHREQALIALLVRYHRKGTPTDGGLGAVLEVDDLERVARLAALLRLSEYLERSKAQRVRGVRAHLSDGYVQLEVVGDEAQVELREAAARRGLFERAYGVTLELSVGS